MCVTNLEKEDVWNRCLKFPALIWPWVRETDILCAPRSLHFILNQSLQRKNADLSRGMCKSCDNTRHDWQESFSHSAWLVCDSNSSEAATMRVVVSYSAMMNLSYNRFVIFRTWWLAANHCVCIHVPFWIVDSTASHPFVQPCMWALFNCQMHITRRACKFMNACIWDMDALWCRGTWTAI